MGLSCIKGIRRWFYYNLVALIGIFLVTLTIKLNKVDKLSTTLKHQNVYTFNQQWEPSTVCKPYDSFQNYDDFRITNYTSNAGTIPIFIHNPERDYVSREIKTKGAFDVHLVNKVLLELRENIDLHLIDIGTNVGTFCLAAALFGRRCIGIDAAESNIQHVCASVEWLKYESKITLIHNALSDSHTSVEIQINDEGDYGAIFINVDNIQKLKVKSPAFRGKSSKAIKVNTAMLDDVLSLPEISHFRKVFIKMDVEGYEHRVLLGAKELFSKLDVHGILMEWNWHVSRESSAQIKNLLTAWGYIPVSLEDNEPLDVNNSDKWSNNIMWYPKKENML